MNKGERKCGKVIAEPKELIRTQNEVRNLAEYYFDTETTGFDFDKDEIITIQWQEVDRFTGEPIGELRILKSWESSEKKNLREFCPKFNVLSLGFRFYW